MDAIDDAVGAIAAGACVVYPTETVYGLGADATDSDAVETVFRLKGRERSNPLSIAVSSVSRVTTVARPSRTTRQFMETFLPGPVTVICTREPGLPDELTAGLDRVGVRIPDHPVARQLLRATPPLTATSANPSGGKAVCAPDELDPGIRSGVATVLDGGPSSGEPSTVVDVAEGIIHRRGAEADRVEEWLSD